MQNYDNAIMYTALCFTGERPVGPEDSLEGPKHVTKTDLINVLYNGNYVLHTCIVPSHTHVTLIIFIQYFYNCIKRIQLVGALYYVCCVLVNLTCDVYTL
jgi:hypothetical protein